MGNRTFGLQCGDGVDKTLVFHINQQSVLSEKVCSNDRSMNVSDDKYPSEGTA